MREPDRTIIRIVPLSKGKLSLGEHVGLPVRETILDLVKAKIWIEFADALHCSRTSRHRVAVPRLLIQRQRSALDSINRPSGLCPPPDGSPRRRAAALATTAARL